MTDIRAELQERVREAVSRGSPLQIVGGGSKAGLGREPCGERLEVGSHAGVIEYEPSELVVTVRAGTRVEALQTELGRHGQCLGCDPPAAGGATIGGVLACNQSGPARPWLGSVRDHVLGIGLIDGRGEYLRFGGRVMKNVAGYDVSRLQAGAMGCLGIITEVTLRLYPQPALESTVVVRQDRASAIDRMSREARRGGPLSAACWVDGLLHLRFSGNERAVRARRDECAGEPLPDAVPFWSGIRERSHGYFDGQEPLWRLTARPAAPVADDSGEWLIDWGGAQRWLKGPGDLASRERMAEKIGGEATSWRSGDRSGEVFHARTPAQRRVHEALKNAFDPQRIFNPGRLYSWL
jgi:glycolate oxidase FAD binding subunit